MSPIVFDRTATVSRLTPRPANHLACSAVRTPPEVTSTLSGSRPASSALECRRLSRPGRSRGRALSGKWPGSTHHRSARHGERPPTKCRR